MNIKEIKSSIWEKLNEKIQKEKLAVKGKRYFVWKNILSFVLGLIFLAVVLFCLSFIAFFISRNNLFFFGHFGMRGWQSLLLAFPWLLLILAVILIFVLEFIFKKYQIVYRKPLVYSLGLLVVSTFILGTVIARTSWHDSLSEQARGRRLPVLGGMYRNFEEPNNLYVGQLKERTEKIWTINLRSGQTRLVLISDSTQFPRGENFILDDLLLVAGSLEDEKIEAWGIVPFQPHRFDHRFERERPMMK